MRDGYMQQAFEIVCREAKQAAGAYVCLMERQPFYGGPEEGGWWGGDTVVVAYQYYPTEEAAEAAYEAVKKLAGELSQAARTEHGRQCLRELEWLEARGLEADWLPEPDGPAEYYVEVCQGLPSDRHGDRQWS